MDGSNDVCYADGDYERAIQPTALHLVAATHLLRSRLRRRRARGKARAWRGRRSGC